jgi:DNA-binding NarL/FixJ family response regulator
VTEALIRGMETREPLDAPALAMVEPLTPRETEVLRLMAAAYTNREIAEALGAAEGTVKIHVSNVLSKLGARDRTQAVLRSLELRLL